MSDFFEEMLGSIDSLSEEQIHELLSRLEVKQSKNKQEKLKADKTSGTICVHCGSSKIKKHGFKSGRQRYYCKDCNKTFTISTNSILYRSRLTPAQWKELCRGMVENLSLQKIAYNMDISTPAVWYNKQKICNMLLDLYGKQDSFIDIAECDEYYPRLSFKGKRDPEFFINTLGRMPRHYRTKEQTIEYLKKYGLWDKLKDNPAYIQELIGKAKARPRGISNEKVCVLTCRDRSGNLYASPICLGHPEMKDIQKHLTGRFAKDAILVTDSLTSYPQFAKKERIQLVKIESGKHAKGAYNLSRINALHSRLSDYCPKAEVNSLATKYIDLELIFFWWLEKHSNLTTPEKVEKLYNLIMQNKNETTYEELTNRPLTLNTKGLIPKEV